MLIEITRDEDSHYVDDGDDGDDDDDDDDDDGDDEDWGG